MFKRCVLPCVDANRVDFAHLSGSVVVLIKSKTDPGINGKNHSACGPPYTAHLCGCAAWNLHTFMTEDLARRSLFYTLIASLAFATMAAMIKAMAPALPTEMAVFFRNFFGFLSVLPLVLRERVSLRTENLRWHVVRAVFGLVAMYCFFYALGLMPLGDAVLLNYTAPLFTPLIALLWLREAVPTVVRIAIGMGFLGIVLILKPGHELFTPVALLGLASGLFAAFAMITIRRMAQTESALRIVFYFGAIASALSAIPLFWHWQSMSWAAALPLVAIGILASIGQLFLTKAYLGAPAARVGALTYLTVVVAALYGWFFWGEAPDIFSLVGATLVFMGGALAIGWLKMPFRH